MNYHIMVDDKFIDRFIDDVEKVSPLNSNVFFVRGQKNNPKYVQSKNVIWIDLNDDDFLQTIKNCTANDKVIVHWYDLAIGNLLLSNLKNDIPVYVALWGGEFYEDPYLYHIDWIHDKETLKFVKNEYIIKDKYKHKWKYFFKRFWIKYNYKNKAAKDFAIKKKTIERIDKLLLPIHDDAEVEVIKKIYKLDHLEYSYFNYDINVDFSEIILNQQDEKSNEIITIQIGNSATESNNHVDAFNAIKKFKNNSIDIFLPLSYGSSKYAKFVKENGNNLFSNKITYDEVFIPREQYIKKLQNTDICIMYHNRQQAFGNCIPLLMLGKKLYIKSNNPLYELFTSIGVKIFDANTIQSLDFSEFSKPLSEIEKNENRNKIKNLFSQEKRLEYLKNILN